MIETAPTSEGEGCLDRWTVISSEIEANINNYYEDNILVSKREQFPDTSNSETITNWGKIGVAFITNLCNALTESVLRGLQNLHPQFESGCRLLIETLIRKRMGFLSFQSVIN